MSNLPQRNPGRSGTSNIFSENGNTLGHFQKGQQTGTFSEEPILTWISVHTAENEPDFPHCVETWPWSSFHAMVKFPHWRRISELRTWSTGCSAHCGLQCLYQLRPPFLGKTAASRAGLKKTFALQLRMNHGKRQRCSLYFSFRERLKNHAYKQSHKRTLACEHKMVYQTSWYALMVTLV